MLHLTLTFHRHLHRSLLVVVNRWRSFELEHNCVFETSCVLTTMFLVRAVPTVMVSIALQNAGDADITMVFTHELVRSAGTGHTCCTEHTR